MGNKRLRTCRINFFLLYLTSRPSQLGILAESAEFFRFSTESMIVLYLLSNLLWLALRRIGLNRVIAVSVEFWNPELRGKTEKMYINALNV